MHMLGTFERAETIGECMRERSIEREASGASVPHAADAVAPAQGCDRRGWSAPYAGDGRAEGTDAGPVTPSRA